MPRPKLKMRHIVVFFYQFHGLCYLMWPVEKGGGSLQARVNRKPFRKLRGKNETFKNVTSQRSGLRDMEETDLCQKNNAAIFRFSMSAVNLKKAGSLTNESFLYYFFVMKNPVHKIFLPTCGINKLHCAQVNHIGRRH
jgi:hypothetical protein